MAGRKHRGLSHVATTWATMLAVSLLFPALLEGLVTPVSTVDIVTGTVSAEYGVSFTTLRGCWDRSACPNGGCLVYVASKAYSSPTDWSFEYGRLYGTPTALTGASFFAGLTNTNSIPMGVMFESKDASCTNVYAAFYTEAASSVDGKTATDIDVVVRKTDFSNVGGDSDTVWTYRAGRAGSTIQNEPSENHFSATGTHVVAGASLTYYHDIVTKSHSHEFTILDSSTGALSCTYSLSQSSSADVYITDMEYDSVNSLAVFAGWTDGGLYSPTTNGGALVGASKDAFIAYLANDCSGTTGLQFSYGSTESRVISMTLDGTGRIFSVVENLSTQTDQIVLYRHSSRTLTQEAVHVISHSGGFVYEQGTTGKPRFELVGSDIVYDSTTAMLYMTVGQANSTTSTVGGLAMVNPDDLYPLWLDAVDGTTYLRDIAVDSVDGYVFVTAISGSTLQVKKLQPPSVQITSVSTTVDTRGGTVTIYGSYFHPSYVPTVYLATVANNNVGTCSSVAVTLGSHVTCVVPEATTAEMEAVTMLTLNYTAPLASYSNRVSWEYLPYTSEEEEVLSDVAAGAAVGATIGMASLSQADASKLMVRGAATKSASSSGVSSIGSTELLNLIYAVQFLNTLTYLDMELPEDFEALASGPIFKALNFHLPLPHSIVSAGTSRRILDDASAEAFFVPQDFASIRLLENVFWLSVVLLLSLICHYTFIGCSAVRGFLLPVCCCCTRGRKVGKLLKLRNGIESFSVTQQLKWPTLQIFILIIAMPGLSLSTSQLMFLGSGMTVYMLLAWCVFFFMIAFKIWGVYVIYCATHYHDIKFKKISCRRLRREWKVLLRSNGRSKGLGARVRWMWALVDFWLSAPKGYWTGGGRYFIKYNVLFGSYSGAVAHMLILSMIFQVTVGFVCSGIAALPFKEDLAWIQIILLIPPTCAVLILYITRHPDASRLGNIREILLKVYSLVSLVVALVYYLENQNLITMPGVNMDSVFYYVQLGTIGFRMMFTVVNFIQPVISFLLMIHGFMYRIYKVLPCCRASKQVKKEASAATLTMLTANDAFHSAMDAKAVEKEELPDFDYKPESYIIVGEVVRYDIINMMWLHLGLPKDKSPQEILAERHRDLAALKMQLPAEETLYPNAVVPRGATTPFYDDKAETKQGTFAAPKVIRTPAHGTRLVNGRLVVANKGVTCVDANPVEVAGVNLWRGIVPRAPSTPSDRQDSPSAASPLLRRLESLNNMGSTRRQSLLVSDSGLPMQDRSPESDQRRRERLVKAKKSFERPLTP